ncbi:unnamed protein product [Caenorhabditis angaria]|uniref:Sas10 C-terminal domain-containing protein n=1 Tax=Caenorhabditis angaria TaxID=860376 RepID=A0A9P1MVL8_9PELO|nr:unnamed protein product [Caenorhabditis angaria]
MSRRSGKASAHISHEDNNEELIDEINSFHAKDREIKAGTIYKKRKFDRPEELLSVEAEASDSSDNDDGSDFDDEDMNDITDNKWGKKRKDFYGTGFVDKDWGGMREEEMEDAQLEEEDALTRQKLLDKSTAVIADLFDDDDEEEDDQNDQSVQVSTALEFNETNAKKKNKKTLKLLEQYEARKRIFDLVVKPLDGIINELPEKSALKSQLVYVAQTYAAYLMNVAYLLKLRAEQFNREKLEDPLIDLHPVVESLKKLHKRIAECEDFLHTNSEYLDELKSMVDEENKEKLSELCEKVGNVGLSRKKIANKELEKESVEEKPLNYTTMDGDSESKRKANEKIAKNKEYHDKRGKKKATISKTKNRKKVRAIEKRVKSQIGNVRREMQKYSGETGGIRASTIKSTKLIA